MSIASIRDFESYKITLHPERGYFTDHLLTAGEMMEGLKEMIDKDPLWISDMFPCNYIYKPIFFDTINVRSDDEYKILKRIKKARYIQWDILKMADRLDELIREVMTGDIKVQGDFLLSAYEDTAGISSKEIHPEFENPIVFNIAENEKFDIYIASSLSAKSSICECERVVFKDMPYKLEKVMPIQQKRPGNCFVIQADYSIMDGHKIMLSSDSVFRIKADLEKGEQYFKAGSVFGENDLKETGEMNGYYPFILFLGGKI